MRIVRRSALLLSFAALVVPLSAAPATAAASDPLVAIPRSTFGLHWYPINPAFPGNGPYGPTTLLDDGTTPCRVAR
jgi:hypothetical protein